MLMHLVSFKYKAGTSGEARADHRRRLAGLAGLDGVVDLKVGEDVVKSARSYDTGLMVVFRDRAALDAYQKQRDLWILRDGERVTLKGRAVPGAGPATAPAKKPG